MPKIKRDPLKTGFWKIDENLTVAPKKYKHLEVTGYASKKDAETDLPVQEALFRERHDFNKSHDSFDGLCDRFLASQKEVKKPTTWHDLERDVKSRLAAPLKGKSVNEVFSGDTLERWRRQFLKDTEAISSKRVNLILADLEKMGKFSFELGIIGEAGYRRVLLSSERISQRIKPKIRYQIWNHDQYKAFINTFSADDKYIVLFQWLFFSGCRIGEALALQWSDVDFAERAVYITKSSSPGVGTGKTEIFTTKTSAGRRAISLTEDMIGQFKKLKFAYQAEPDNFVFYGKAPASRHAIRVVFSKHTREAGLPYMKIHEIRHTVNTWLLTPIRTPDEIKAIAVRQGHSSIKVTWDVYFHQRSETEKKLSEELKI